MSTNKKTRSDQSKETGFRRMERFHPHKTLLFFALVGSTVLFLSMSFLYVITISRSGTPIDFQLPKSFSVSTVFILLSSFSITGAIKAFRNDSMQELKMSLVTTLGFGMCFCLSQAIGLKAMINSGYFVSSNVGVSYLYVI